MCCSCPHFSTSFGEADRSNATETKLQYVLCVWRISVMVTYAAEKMTQMFFHGHVNEHCGCINEEQNNKHREINVFKCSLFNNTHLH